ncbi:MAG: hypothetical protein HGA59_00590 [Chlorobiaceae bacterium]|nr:hypothetical protein [Chlorobiaceae bacterium]NTV15963.1 hypothetical protein [Chlorobiaceae bacterium]
MAAGADGTDGTAAGVTSFWASTFLATAFLADFFLVLFLATFFAATGASTFASVVTAGFAPVAVSAKETPPNIPAIARETITPAIKFFFIVFVYLSFASKRRSNSFSFLLLLRISLVFLSKFQLDVIFFALEKLQVGTSSGKH